MKIETTSPDLHAELTALANDYPDLVFQNNGYEYIGLAKREAHATQIARIEEILKEHIIGFVRFFNFRRDDGEIRLRFDFNWGAENNSMYYVGVGYLSLDHLRDGFPKEPETSQPSPPVVIAG